MAKKNEAFREWIRRQPCCVTGALTGEKAQFVVECAHVKSRGAGGEDAGNIVPLIRQLHRAQHSWGIQSFEKFYGIDLKAEAASYWAAFLKETGGQHESVSGGGTHPKRSLPEETR